MMAMFHMIMNFLIIMTDYLQNDLDYGNDDDDDDDDDDHHHGPATWMRLQQQEVLPQDSS